MISLENYLLFRIIVSLFNVIIAYMVFIIVWKSKTFSENRYLTFIGTALFFVACLGFLRAFAYEKMDVFPGYGANLPVQLWIAIRYLLSISFFVAPLLFIQGPGSEKRSVKHVENSQFAQKVFIVYTAITAVLLLSIFKYRNFPDCYIEGSGLTSFKIFSEYLISFLFLGSVILLYRKKDRFDKHVFSILIAAIVASILAELALIHYTNTEESLNFIGQIFNALSFYLIYIAIVETGFVEPCSLLFRELKFREEALKRETNFLKDDQGRIYRMLGVEKPISESIMSTEKLKGKTEQYKTEQYKTEQYNTEQYSSFLQEMQGLIAFRLDEKGALVFMDGDVREITGYSKEDFISGKVKWTEIVLPEYRPLILENLRKMELEPNSSPELEYQVRKKDGNIRWVRQIIHITPVKSGISGKFQGFVRDITQRKKAEEALARTEEARIKEIHHRIKNNLQVISSLLSLQADKLNDKETFQASEVFEAFRESQNRVVSMALIHEELYQGKDMETLEFSAYLRKLTADLLKSYNIENENIKLNLELEQVFLGMDTAVPLGIIVNELISNSLKHAFPEGTEGEIRISLYGLDDSRTEGKTAKLKKGSDLQFTLIVADNGKGLPENIDFRNTDSLGLQLVNILVEQIEGSIELKRNSGTKYGTEFKITFRKPER
ncbi:MASE3 domain-containing protein [Methanosarcina sp.]|uniref:MASE3 domain-containing protein n=1 Tax=Methanosarcina sp. TaxID=2213 RepID=UPI002AB92591|nr:MASE3 domain-containing protein [Methanosarcina sp.]MDY9926758.1 MASE3 domain-containing protein [Methanosarcina sp.]